MSQPTAGSPSESGKSNANGLAISAQEHSPFHQYDNITSAELNHQWGSLELFTLESKKYYAHVCQVCGIHQKYGRKWALPNGEPGWETVIKCRGYPTHAKRAIQNAIDKADEERSSLHPDNREEIEQLQQELESLRLDFDFLKDDKVDLEKKLANMTMQLKEALDSHSAALRRILNHDE